MRSSPVRSPSDDAPPFLPLGERVPPLVGRSREAARLRELVARVASTPCTTVLVDGPRGSGRRAVAHEIHRRSAAPGRFAVLECGSATPASFASALAACAGGSLVLHEVQRLAPAVQELLLDHLQERQGLGSARAQGPDERSFAALPRLIATTSCDLAACVAAGAFRDDLHYRINVLALSVPPLERRREDLGELAAATLAALAHEHGAPAPAIQDAALDALAAHAWRGHLAELGAVLEAAFLRTADGGVLDADALGLAPVPAAEPGVDAGASLALGDRSLRALEEALIRHVLDESSGNRSRAARVLGVNRATLYNKLKLYGI